MTATRVVNRVLAILFALALLLGALLALVEIVLMTLGRPAWLVPHEEWSRWLRSHTWDTPVVDAALAVLVLVGIVLVVVALRPGAPATLQLPSATPGVEMRASRRSVEKSLATAASRTTGVTGATASAGRRSVQVRVTTRTRSQSDLQEEVAAVVEQRLASLGLADQLRTQVRVAEEAR